MGLIEPESMDQCVYFTQRAIGKGSVKVWVFRGECTQCKEGVMGKPRGAKGKVKTRADEYECPKCHYKVHKQEYEDSLLANVKYTCPHCQHKGEAQVSFKRKNIDGVQTLRASCEKCKGNIDITKKMKEPKKKEGI